MTTETRERAIPETVKLGFDPEEVGGTVTEVFRDDVARTIWCAYRAGHLVTDGFDEECLAIASAVRAHPPASAWHLERIMGRYGRSHFSPFQGGQQQFSRELFLILSEKRPIPYEVVPPSERRR